MALENAILGARLHHRVVDVRLRFAEDPAEMKTFPARDRLEHVARA